MTQKTSHWTWKMIIQVPGGEAHFSGQSIAAADATMPSVRDNIVRDLRQRNPQAGYGQVLVFEATSTV